MATGDGGGCSLNLIPEQLNMLQVASKSITSCFGQVLHQRHTTLMLLKIAADDGQ